MSDLMHNGQVIQTTSADWQTRSRGSNSNEYDIYMSCADDGKGMDRGTGKPLKSYDEWVQS
jgi:hypothetical protein